MLDEKTVLVTGGTGSFGQQLTRLILKNHRVKKLVILSRDEMKQWKMAREFSHDSRVRFFIGDVRDRDRLHRAFHQVDYVIHAAATKIVPIAEYNPFECVKTNVFGAMNVIDAAIDQRVSRVIALSTDKASSPVNLYGATKLTSDKLFIAGNAYSNPESTIFSVVRYGNVMGSRGSILPLFKSMIESGSRSLPITDPRMTRFMLSLQEAVNLVLLALNDSLGGEIYIKKSPSMRVTEIAEAFGDNIEKTIIGIRPGEKLHEQMIGPEDSPFTYEYKDIYKILPAINQVDDNIKRIKNGKLVPPDFIYDSQTNVDWMPKEVLKQWLIENSEIMEAQN